MIIDKKNRDLYFSSSKSFIDWLNIDNSIDTAIPLEICSTEQDYVDFANEYELKLNEGTAIHEWTIM